MLTLYRMYISVLLQAVSASGRDRLGVTGFSFFKFSKSSWYVPFFSLGVRIRRQTLGAEDIHSEGELITNDAI